MSILIEQHPAVVPISYTFPPSARDAGPEWRSPTKGSIVALDAADVFAALLHHRIMAESTRMEHAARRASALENGVQSVLICTDTRNRDIATPLTPVN